MDIIKKIVNLDELKSHRVGILNFIPYDNITPIVENGNYGGFVYDSKNVKYLDILRRYNNIQEILRHGIFLKRGKNGKYVIPESLKEFKCGINIPLDEDCIYDYTPCDIKDFTYNSKGYYYSNNNYKEEKIVLVEDIKTIVDIEKWWLELTGSSGNLQFCKDFEKLALSEKERLCDEGRNVNFSFDKIPSIDIPLLLENETVSEELYYPYEYSMNSNGKIIPSYTATTNEVKMIDVSNEDIYVESKLQTLKSLRTVYVDDNIHGIFLNDGNLYKYQDGVWTLIEDEGFECGDGEDLLSNQKKYRNIPTKSCVDNFYLEEGGVYYFLVKYENSEEFPLRIPYDNNHVIFNENQLPTVKNSDCYSLGEDVYIWHRNGWYKSGILGLNRTTYENNDPINPDITIYDKIDSVKYHDDNLVTIKYIIGATRGDEYSTGIHYEETLKYEVKKKMVTFDGVFECELWFEEIDYENSKKDFYNEEFKTWRKINQSKLIKYERLVELPIKTMLITKEDADGLQESPKYNINLEINRGASSAWENHFKLMECNTMEDLENYGNNYFNL